jgi:hypothetical protein
MNPSAQRLNYPSVNQGSSLKLEASKMTTSTMCSVWDETSNECKKGATKEL